MNVSTLTVSELEQLQTEFAAAQAAEAKAISALSEHGRARSDGAKLAALLAEVHAARERAVAAYEAWNAAAKTFYAATSSKPID